MMKCMCVFICVRMCVCACEHVQKEQVCERMSMCVVCVPVCGATEISQESSTTRLYTDTQSHNLLSLGSLSTSFEINRRGKYTNTYSYL